MRREIAHALAARERRELKKNASIVGLIGLKIPAGYSDSQSTTHK